MKKFLLALLTVSLSLTASAENTPDESTESGSYRVTEDKLNEVIEQLKSIEGYVFISKGERRELSTVFQKAPDILGDDENEIKSHDWEIANSSIAELQNNEGTVLGVNYGQTSLTVTDDKGVVHYFVIFVCPTMTVVSPEGAIYTHQKVYGQHAKVSFTHSNDYLINCVMMNFQGEVKDITDKVAKETSDETGDTDGYYESEELVKDDMIFTVSMKNNPNSANNTEVVDNSGVRIQVQNKK